MDLQKPSPIETPVTPTTRTLVQRQPTYTTAGTLYNPGSSQPLQPPTRRGRSNRYNLPNGYIDLPLELLPRTDSGSLPLRGSDDRPSGYHQYSPLQQNYDRAVSPATSPTANRKSSVMSAEGMRFQSMKAPQPATPLAFGRPEAPVSTNNNDAESDDDSDSDFGTNPLRGMTVKSLHNLASYPNPNQEKAQKALLRGTKPRLNGHGTAASRGNAPEQQHHQVRPVFPLTIHAASANASTRVHGERPAPRRNPPSTMSLGRGDVASLRRSIAPPPGLPVRAIMPGMSGSILAAGPGAPTPLTAGPPGLRQYRPSTFETTFKALGTNNGLQTTAEVQSENAPNVQEQPASLAALVRDSQPDLGPVGHGRPGQSRNSNRNTISRAHSSLSLDLSSENEPSASSYELKMPSWNDPDPQTRLKFKPGTDRLTEEEVEKRARENERLWVARTGSNAFWKPTSSMQRPAFGEVTSATAFTTSFAHMNVEDAKVLTPADHAKPLLDAALATLQRCSQEKWFQDILSKYD